MKGVRDLPDFPIISTITVLRDWDQQSTAAERLCADILRLEEFENVDPQSPIGGPDGGKDLLCEKGGMAFVVACHFPQGQMTFAVSRKKFGADLGASIKHGRDGFIFMTNQHLTPHERAELEKEAAQQGKRCLIFHREHLRVILDSPKGYGIRLRHLRIPLTMEEQFAYFASTNENVASALSVHTRAIERLSGRINRIAKAQAGLVMESAAVIVDAIRSGDKEVDVGEMLRVSADAAAAGEPFAPAEAVSANLSTALLRYLHRLRLPADPFAGKYRQTQVWLVDPTGTVNADLECSSWDKVPTLMEELVSDWNRKYGDLIGADERLQIAALARFFHGLLTIHPFIDGNGRLAREVLSLQARDLWGLGEDLLLERGPKYYRSLRLADAGELAELEQLIQRAVDCLEHPNTR